MGSREKAFCAIHNLNINGKVKSNKLSNPIGEKGDEILDALSRKMIQLQIDPYDEERTFLLL